MGQAGSKQIAFVVEEHLGFVDQAAKRRGMHNPVPVALKITARGRCNFNMASSP
jgi:hypothetical protein